jgi:hypothetical protein
MMLSNTGREVRLVVQSKDCSYLFDPDPVAMAARYGAHTSVSRLAQRLVCSHCGGREVDMVLTGTKRRGDET